VLFDTDTLRYAAGWTGPGFINWRSIVLDGSHQTHAKIVGDRVFTNPVAPGWGRPGTGTFADVRIRGRDEIAYGPLPRDWGHWKGLYRDGKRVVLSYTLGDIAVLDSPASRSFRDTRAISRTLNLGRRSEVVRFCPAPARIRPGRSASDRLE